MTTAQMAKAKSTRKPKTSTRVAKNTKAANTKIANRMSDVAEGAGERIDVMTESVQERTQGAVGRVVNLTKKAIEFQRENAEACIESGKITAEGVVYLGRTNLAFTRDNLVAVSRALQGMASRGTLRQLLARSTDYVIAGANRVLNQAVVNVDTVIEITGNAYEPIGDRFNDIKADVSKAA